MARPMAVVLAAMRLEGVQEKPAMPRSLLSWLIGAGILALGGAATVLLLVPDWRGMSISVLWVLLVGIAGYAGLQLWRSTQRYKQAVQLQARQEVLRLEGRYKALVQQASDVFLILSAEGQLQYASPSVERNLGYPPTQVEGTKVQEYLHPEDRPLVETALKRQSSAFFTIRLQHREGAWRYFEAIGQPLFSDPLVGGYLLTVRDVTDRKREEVQRREKEAAALRLAVERERAEYEKSLIEQSKRELEAAYKIIEQKNREIEESLTYAARIQQGMVASAEQLRQYLPESFVFWRPRDVVSGDFYWFLPLEGRLYLAVADCTGHGVPGALMTMISSAMLTQAVLGEGLRDPDAILSAVHVLMRRALRQDLPGAKSEDGMDIALVCYEPQQRRLYYAGANRPLWIASPGSEELTEVRADRKAVGGASAPAQHFFTLQVLEPVSGSWVYISSDGFGDQFGGLGGRKYMGKRFKQLLYRLSSLSAQAQAEALGAELDSWRGDYVQVDDILVLGFRV